MLNSRVKAKLPSRSERGFTLIETLVAILTGIIVMLVLFTILEVSIKQSKRLSDVSEASQLGRVAMNHVVDELHSVCLSEGFAPVQPESSENQLIVVNGYSEAAEVPTVGTFASGVRKDKIVYSPSAKTLTDYTYYATGSPKAGEYTFASTPSPSTGVLLGKDITQMTVVKGGKEVKQPVFQYYAYSTSAATSTSTASSQLKEETLLKEGETLSTTTAPTVAAVDVSFSAGPLDGEEKGRLAPLTSEVAFAFEAPNIEATEDKPCA